MSTYKIYELGTDGHVSGPPEVVNGERDSDAIYAARERKTTGAKEVWQDTRLVAVVRPDGN